MKQICAAAVFAALAMMAAPASHATLLIYDAILTGPAESPPNASPGVGTADIDIDTVAATMEVKVTFSGLLGTTTASHIHCCTTVPGTGTAGVATITPTFTLFPLGVTSGTYDHVYDLTALSGTYNPAFIAANGGTAAGAEAALLAGLAAGESYLNIHTSVVPGGEIRGFLVAPEPASIAVMTVGLLGLGWHRRRARR